MIIQNREQLQALRAASLKQIDKQTKKIYVCGGTGCVAGGSMEIYEELKKYIEAIWKRTGRKYRINM